MIYRPFERFGGYILKQYISVRAVLEIIVGEAAAPDYFFGRASSTFFAYQWPNNVKMYKETNFDQNISGSSRVMSMFTFTGGTDAR